MTTPQTSKRVVRIGIGGPVGSGKTMLVLRLCQWLRGELSIAVVTNDEWMVWISWLNRLFVDADLRVFDDPSIALEWLEAE